MNLSNIGKFLQVNQGIKFKEISKTCAILGIYHSWYPIFCGWRKFTSSYCLVCYHGMLCWPPGLPRLSTSRVEC